MILRRTRVPEPLAGSEHELVTMTRDLDQMHHDLSVPALRTAAAEAADAAPRPLTGGLGGRTSRRTFLLGTGAAAVGGVLLAACGSGHASATQAGASASSSGSSRYPATLTGDLAVAALAASLENLGVLAYTQGIAAATAGKLGTVPPAVVTFAKTARAQHVQHAAAWNAILAAAGKAKVTETDPALTPTVTKQLAKVTDVTGLATLALTVEEIAAETYQAGISEVTSTKAVQTAASIQPVEMQHAAILNFVLGKYPVPDAFSPTSGARTPHDLSA